MSVFDKIYDRTKSLCVKYENAKEENLLPFWIADMDFEVAKPIQEAIIERAKHPIFGYTVYPEEYYTSFINWQKRKNNVDMDRKRLTSCHDVVQGLSYILESIIEEGTGILVQPPVYYPFYKIIEAANCKRIDNPLVLNENEYTIDFEDFENKIKDNNVKIFIFCSPHNPLGKVWTKDELEKMVSICEKYSVTILSDEIHSDLIHEGRKHIPTFTVSKWAGENVISLYSTGKTFNLAGIHSAYAYFNNVEQMEKYDEFRASKFASKPNLFGVFANVAAFDHGKEWFDELMIYLKENIIFFDEYLKENMPKITFKKPDASFVLWINCKELGLNDDELNNFFKDAGVMLNQGIGFGDEGSGFMRWNIACPRETLKKGLDLVKKEYDKRF